MAEQLCVPVGTSAPLAVTKQPD
eukprot:COSAG02_NODE_38462_length_428_cov_2.066869_1_plen_22_part_10